MWPGVSHRGEQINHSINERVSVSMVNKKGKKCSDVDFEEGLRDCEK